MPVQQPQVVHGPLGLLPLGPVRIALRRLLALWLNLPLQSVNPSPQAPQAAVPAQGTSLVSLEQARDFLFGAEQEGPARRRVSSILRP